MKQTILIITFILTSLLTYSQIAIIATTPDSLTIDSTYKITLDIAKDGLLTYVQLTIPTADYLQIANLKTDGGKIYNYPNQINIVWTNLNPNKSPKVEFDLKLINKNLPKELNLKFILSYLVSGMKGEIIHQTNYELTSNNTYQLKIQ